MIRCLLISAALLLTLLQPAPLRAQPVPYAFSHALEPYVPLTGATVLPSGANWYDAGSVPVQLGFTFEASGSASTQLYIFGGTLSSKPIQPFVSIDFWLFAYATQNVSLRPFAESEVRYRTDGVAPYRIFKIEWYKVGFDGPAGEISFQAWLYESSNAIQVRMGPQQIPNPAAVFEVGISGPATVIFEDINGSTSGFAELQAVTGPASQPSDTVISNYPSFLFYLPAVTGLPPEGRVYTFGMPTSAVGEAADPVRLLCFPNPATDRVHFTAPADETVTLELIDAAGNLAWRSRLPPGIASVAVPSGLRAGPYILRRLGTRTEQTQVMLVR